MEISCCGLKLAVPDSVYLPSDDSLMLAEAAVGLRGNVLEIGCGSGVASLAAAKTAESVLGVDINPEAVKCAKSNAEKNRIANASFIESDLFATVPSDAKFDAILFNPPYLPTGEEERVYGPLNHAFDGGKDGREVLDRFLAGFGTHLRQEGVVLLLQSSLNNMEKTRATLEGVGYVVEIIGEKAFFFEKLYMIRARKGA
jgi:release factor glutamine methyltransferase